MAARRPIIAVPKNLYKHFAVLTVVLTACVAMFAEGDSREQIAKQIAAHQEAKAQEMRVAERKKQRMVAGLQDNRSYVVNGNPDVGAPPVGPQESGIYSIEDMPEWGEYELPSKERLARKRKSKRKVPIVLPPGMPPIPGMPDSAEDSANAQEDAA